MATKPMITVDLKVLERRNYHLPVEAAQFLDQYADFLTALAKKEGRGDGAKVTPGDVIASLTKKPAKDPMFLAWLKALKANA